MKKESRQSALVIPGEAKAPLGVRTPKRIESRHHYLEPQKIVQAVWARLRKRIRKLEPIKEGLGSAVYALQTLSGEELILKAYLFSDTQPLDVEISFYEIIRRQDVHIPVPSIELIDLSGELVPCPYYIAQRLPGTSMLNLLQSSNDELLQVYIATIGNVLGSFHNIPGFSDPSTLEACNNQGGIYSIVIQPFGSAARRLQFDQRYNQVRALDLLPSTFLQSLGEIIEEYYPVPGFCLLHGDPSPRNFLFNGSSLSGVLDGAAKIGLPDEELISALVSVWLIQRYRVSVNAKDACMVLVDSYAGVLNRPMWANSPLPLLAERIVTRIDTYSRLGQLKETLPLLLELWEYANAGPWMQ